MEAATAAERLSPPPLETDVVRGLGWTEGVTGGLGVPFPSAAAPAALVPPGVEVAGSAASVTVAGAEESFRTSQASDVGLSAVRKLACASNRSMSAEKSRGSKCKYDL